MPGNTYVIIGQEAVDEMTDRTKALEAELEAVQTRQDTHGEDSALEKERKQAALEQEEEYAKLEAELASRVLKVLTFVSDPVQISFVFVYPL